MILSSIKYEGGTIECDRMEREHRTSERILGSNLDPFGKKLIVVVFTIFGGA